MMNCMVIDDEPLARECLVNYIGQVDFLNCVGVGVSALDIPDLLQQNDVDLIFLDVQMPLMNGLEYIRSNPTLPLTILTTAYPNYAIEGFDLNVLDYLLKPISFHRFFAGITKAKQRHLLLNNQDSIENKCEEANCFFIKCDGKYEKIFQRDILFIKAMQNYVIIQTSKKKYISLLFLKSVEEKLGNDSFMRVHKSYIVSLDKIEGVANHEIQISSYKVPISRNYRKEVMQKILGNNLWNGSSSSK